ALVPFLAMLPSPSSSLAFFLFDSTVTLTLFGYFDSRHFNIRRVFEHLFPLNGYSFLSSPLDFLLIAVIRILLYTASFQLRLAGKNSHVAWLNKPISIFCVACLAFSFLKCLIYSEQKELVECTGFWLLPVWNIICSAYFYWLWSTEFESCFATDDKKEVDDDSDEGSEEEEDQDDEIPLTKTQQVLILCRYAYGPWLAVVMTLSIAAAAVNVVMPHYTSSIMNGITALREAVDISQTVITLAVLTVVSMLLTGLRNGCFSYLTNIITSKMRKDLFHSIVHQEIAFFDTHKSGAIVSRLTTDVDTISWNISDFFDDSFKSILTLAGKMMVMCSLSWRLTLLNFISFPIITYITVLYGDFCDKLGDDQSEATANSHQVAEELISTMRTIRSFAAEKSSSQKFAASMDNALKVAKKEALAKAGLHFSYDFYYNCIYVIVLIYGARLVTAGTLEAATLVTFMMYQMQIGEHILELNREIPAFMGTLGKSRKFCKFLVRKPQISTDGAGEQPVKGELRLDGVSFTYPDRQSNQVLDDFTLHIRAGESIALVGPSGGGKSTIVALLERFYEPDEGQITLDGIPIAEYRHEYYHRKIALVSQEPVLYDCSVRENIGFGCNVSEEEIIAAAKTANAHNFVMGLEDGYETTCGEKGTQMSGGQKQRIAIARALVRNPSVLILDEATSALDNQSEQIVQEALQNCAANRTVIVIAHRLSTIEKADRIAVIEGGRIAQV
ncbi:hypothetical protein PENTCL1PPCAC_7697, partial [Pristionchus entomophagus]